MISPLHAWSCSNDSQQLLEGSSVPLSFFNRSARLMVLVDDGSLESTGLDSATDAAAETNIAVITRVLKRL